MEELSKIDPKCWGCGKFVKPVKVEYQPLRCGECEAKKKKYDFIRPTQEEMEEIIRTTDRKMSKKEPKDDEKRAS